MFPGSIPIEHIQDCFIRSVSQPDSKTRDLEEIIGQELCWTKLMQPQKTKSKQWTQLLWWCKTEHPLSVLLSFTLEVLTSNKNKRGSKEPKEGLVIPICRWHGPVNPQKNEDSTKRVLKLLKSFQDVDQQCKTQLHFFMSVKICMS